jgi:hypothetical protein
MAQNLRVHITAVGFDTESRIVSPLIDFRADKVYLVTHLRDNAQAAKNLENVKKALLRKSPNTSVHVVLADVWSLFSCLGEYRKIFANEERNHLSVNVSTGSKVVVIAGMLSCMLWGGIPYYARLDYSKARPESVVGLDLLPVYKINKPDGDLLRVMSVIKQNQGKLSKKDLIKSLQSEAYQLIPLYGEDSSKTAPHSKLRTLLEPLENDWKFVEVKAKGRRSEVLLTEQGENALRIFGDPATRGLYNV